MELLSSIAPVIIILGAIVLCCWGCGRMARGGFSPCAKRREKDR